MMHFTRWLFVAGILVVPVVGCKDKEPERPKMTRPKLPEYVKPPE